MAISKKRKDELLAQYGAAISDSKAVIVTEHTGLGTTDIDKLRAAVREADGSYNVVKLTLFKLALEQVGEPIPDELLVGPVAVGFCHTEVPAVAKAFKSFAKDHEERFSIKGAIMGGQVLSAQEVESLADLPPLEVIRAQLIGMINGPARNLAGVVAGGVRQVVNVLNAYSEQDQQAAAADA